MTNNVKVGLLLILEFILFLAFMVFLLDRLIVLKQQYLSWQELGITKNVSIQKVNVCKNTLYIAGNCIAK